MEPWKGEHGRGGYRQTQDTRHKSTEFRNGASVDRGGTARAIAALMVLIECSLIGYGSNLGSRNRKILWRPLEMFRGGGPVVTFKLVMGPTYDNGNERKRGALAFLGCGVFGTDPKINKHLRGKLYSVDINHSDWLVSL